MFWNKMRQGVDRRPTIRPPPWGPIGKPRANDRAPFLATRRAQHAALREAAQAATAEQALCGGWSRRCITTKARLHGGGSPLRYPAGCGFWLGLCLTMATHCDHATNMSITSQHVSIVERLVGRHSPAR